MLVVYYQKMFRVPPEGGGTYWWFPSYRRSWLHKKRTVVSRPTWFLTQSLSKKFSDDIAILHTPILWSRPTFIVYQYFMFKHTRARAHGHLIVSHCICYMSNRFPDHLLRQSQIDTWIVSQRPTHRIPMKRFITHCKGA